MKHKIAKPTVLVVKLTEFSMSLGNSLTPTDIGVPLDFEVFLSEYRNSMLYSELQFFTGLPEQPEFIHILEYGSVYNGS